MSEFKIRTSKNNSIDADDSINCITDELQLRMPGEFEKHDGCIMIWPVRPGSWIYDGRDAKRAFSMIANAIARDEHLYMLSDSAHVKEAKEQLSKCENYKNMTVVTVENDDAWARDTGPTFVISSATTRYGISWKFNAWGGDYNGLYAHYEKDDRVASEICNYLNDAVIDASDFVLEGGSIHSDGEGTILTTEACLLSKGRNPELSKKEIEQVLCKSLGGEKVIWLPHGIWQDETDEHVDNVCAFIKPGVVVLAWTDDENDPQYEYSKQAFDLLSKETDAKGRSFEIIKLPIPKKPVCITQYECDGFVFEEGEDMREVGERLAASYVNFYIANHSVIVPQFQDENDTLATTILQKAFPDRDIVPIPARAIIVGGGNIHCITQQIPSVQMR